MGLSRIMAVLDPTQEAQPAVRRAIQSAHMTGALLLIYCCIDEVEELETITAVRQQVAALAAEAADAGIDVREEIECSEQWQQQISRAAARHSIDMIFKGSFEHRDVDRERRDTSDWTLLRLAPCPVLLVKDHRDWSSRRVLAAVKHESTDEEHIRLNHRITRCAQEFADAYGSDAHFVTAFVDRNHPPDAYLMSDALGAPLEHIHIGEGDASSVISHTAEEINADLVVIGTVSRSGLKGAVVGNTSERVLDHTRSDVLVLT